MEAEQCLIQAISELNFGKTYLLAPTIVIHPLDMLKGGLSQVEERVFKEVAMGAGSKTVYLWVGEDLEDDEVLKKTNEKL